MENTRSAGNFPNEKKGPGEPGGSRQEILPAGGVRLGGVRRCYPDGTSEPLDFVTVRETTFRIRADGRDEGTLVCLNNQLRELAIGHLRVAGKIRTAADIRNLRIFPDGDLVVCEADLVPQAERAGTAEKPEAPGAQGKPEKPGSPTSPAGPAPSVWRPEWIFSLARQFAEDTELYRATHCVHSCLLAKEDRILYRSEDIDRYNALEKVTGCALADGADPADFIMYMSGRVSGMMMEKALASGVRTIVSNSTAMAQALEMAERAGATLICRVRPQKFDLMRDAARRSL